MGPRGRALPGGVPIRALITGASGFVGGHLAAACTEAGYEVTGLSRSEGVDLRDAQGVLDAVAAAAPELVFHLAADASVARSWSAPAETLRNNVEGTLNLLEAIRAAAPDARVLVAGSGEQYGPPESLPVDERAPLRPQNPYAVSKCSADLLAGFYADAHGLHVIRTRAFNHTGPGQPETYVVSSFARQIALAEREGRESIEVVTGNLDVQRDFSDVRDVTRAYLAAIDRAQPGVYNVCSGRVVRVADILAALADQSPLRVAQRTDPELVRRHDVMEIRGSHERLTAATGWRPEIPLERTLGDVLDWWRER